MNFSVREFESLKPRLRDDLRFTVQDHGGTRVCVIEDPAASRFHRVGLDEYRFFRSLDGTQTVAAILARLARDAGGESHSQSEAFQMLRWLKENHLLEIESTRAKTGAEQDQRAFRSAVTWLNPLVLRVPLGRPDAFFEKLAARLRPLLGTAGFIVWLAVLLFAGAQIAMEWPRFQRGFDNILARDNWLWLGLVWAALKVVHECGHAVFCRHFGARIREVGVIFVLFVPMGYVDATASLGIASKWKRIGVACAGMYVEMFAAALAALWWCGTPDGELATVLHNTVVMGTALTLFFNANPLLRFDGYFIASDLVGIPNLATRSRAWFQRLGGWLLTGARRLRPELPRGREEWAIAGYGVAAWCWQMLVMAALLIGASVMFKGGGLLLATLAAATWLLLPLAMFLRQVVQMSGSTNLPRLALRTLILAGVAAAALFVPWRKTVVAPGVVEFADKRTLRAECPGFIERVHVRDGDVVEAGTLLVELRNEDATATLERLRLNLAAQEQRARLAYTRDDVAAYQAEQSKLDGMRKNIAENEAFVATLKIRAPAAGRVSGRKLHVLAGAYAQQGAEILSIGATTDREIKVAVGQDAGTHFRAAAGSVLEIWIEGRGESASGKLASFASEATRAVPHPALTAVADGPVAVRRTEDDGADNNPYELAEPHFTATVELPPGVALADGEMARVRFRSPVKVTLFSEARAAIARWVRTLGA